MGAARAFGHGQNSLRIAAAAASFACASRWARSAARGVSAAAPRRALEWVVRQGGAKQKELTVDVLTTWSATDPAAAYEWARTRPDAGALLEPVLQSWSAQNPQAFLQWANSVPASSRNDAMLGLMAVTAAEASPVQAMDYAKAMTNPAMRADFVEQVLGAWEQIDPAGADAFRRQSAGSPGR